MTTNQSLLFTYVRPFSSMGVPNRPAHSCSVQCIVTRSHFLSSFHSCLSAIYHPVNASPVVPAGPRVNHRRHRARITRTPSHPSFPPPPFPTPLSSQSPLPSAALASALLSPSWLAGTRPAALSPSPAGGEAAQ